MKYAVALFAVGMAAGCVDARDEYDKFGARVPDAAPPIDAPIVSALPDVNGELYTLARPPLDEDRFFHFRVTAVMRPVTENTARLDWTAQALDYATLEPVGAPFVALDNEVRNDATVDIPLVGTLHARANAVTTTEVELDATIHAQLIGDGHVCGTLSGTGGPLPLQGSSFGALRIDGPDLPTVLPRCPE
jgi:hypothetical protein